MKTVFTISVLIFTVFTASIAWSKIIHVPSDQPIIQAGIEAASDGDTVLVADGTYKGDGNKNLDFKGKAIIVTSEHGAKYTTIDCQRDGRGFYFHSGENEASVVKGFTIKNGYTDFSGAIYCLDSSPTITNNIIIENFGDYGGGIYCNNSSPDITNNTVERNKAYFTGGGIACYSSSPNITNNTIKENSGSDGGGIYCFDSSPTIINNTIIGNKSNYYGGGGIACVESSPSITSNIIKENSSNRGGGIFCYKSSFSLSGNIIEGNLAFSEGGGIYCKSFSSPIIINNIVAENWAASYGGGITCYKSSSPTIVNNTIVKNKAENTGGAIACHDYSSPIIINTILWDDNNMDMIYLSTHSSITITHSNIQGGWTGEGNIDTDPLFINPDNGDYHLSDISPCISVGIMTTNVPTTDIEGNPRPNPPSSNPDMGAYEHYKGVPKEHDNVSDEYVIWNPTQHLVIVASSNSAWGTSTVIDTDNNLWVAWAERNNDLSTYDIYIKRYDGSWNEAQRIVSDGHNPELAIGADGKIWLVWPGGYFPTSAIYASYYDGISWSSPEQLTYISTSPDDYNFDPHITAGSDGKIWVAWRVDNDAYSSIYVKYYDGISWSSPQQITASGSTPRLITGGDERIWIIWNENPIGCIPPCTIPPGDLTARFYNGEWSPPQQISNQHAVSNSIEVAAGTDGKIWVIWRGELQKGIFVKYHDGTKWSEEQLIYQNETKTGHKPHISIGNNNRVWITYCHGNGFSIEYSDGVAWRQNTYIECSRDILPDILPHLEARMEGNIWVFWRDLEEENAGIFYKVGNITSAMLEDVNSNRQTHWDVNRDGIVNIQDLALVSKNFGKYGVKIVGDVNMDTTVDIKDLVLVGHHFGEVTD